MHHTRDASSAADLPSAFRMMMRRMASSIAIVALHDGRPRGMTATSLVSVTMEPPTLLVCVNRSASIYASLHVSQLLSVNIVSQEQTTIADAFAGKVSADERFQHGDWREQDGVPILHGAQAIAICRIVSVTTVGTHALVLAEAVCARSSESCSPLVYCEGSYRTLQDLPM